MIHHGGQLEAHALAEGGGGLDEDILAVERRLDDLALVRAEGRFVELAAQRELKVGDDVRMGAHKGRHDAGAGPGEAARLESTPCRMANSKLRVELFPNETSAW